MFRGASYPTRMFFEPFHRPTQKSESQGQRCMSPGLVLEVTEDRTTLCDAEDGTVTVPWRKLCTFIYHPINLNCSPNCNWEDPAPVVKKIQSRASIGVGPRFLKTVDPRIHMSLSGGGNY